MCRPVVDVKGGQIVRRKDRIRPFCERLAVAWEKYPDMRFGQFICNVYAMELKRDPFYIEDDESMRLIEKFENECSPYHRPPKEET